MYKISLKELIKNIDKQQEETELFDETIYLDLSNKTQERSKGVETIMYDCENGATLILEKDCLTDKIIGLEIINESNI